MNLNIKYFVFSQFYVAYGYFLKQRIDLRLVVQDSAKKKTELLSIFHSLESPISKI